MKEMPRISDSEWKVMQVLWEKSPVTANEIIDTLKKTTDWRPTTIKTLVSRLVKKEAVGFKKNNRTYNYYPLVTEDVCVKAESKSFLKRVYGGGLKMMIANFLEIEDLSQGDIEELRRMLDEKK
ncbi:BlaI/MecI/CopY family transcriptional regulator [Crassaminicella profunda]|uniref:BlaI/MecI/CopY family transcriptional regulator n=1 Tax=Crassaminicella profunda TaxID=1286698 RepID=UPI001CA72CA1|nr:BlaI/MecI/CopY family transcriptional regulator [Crassaminicella profunda]QZY54801.1 BlaI/MecI/CopY family transcriptional regulator [Crassaminicella profunda]